MSVVEITSVEEFDKIIQEDKAIIKVSTTTCGPCKMITPLFEALSKENQDSNFYSYSPDTYPELAAHANSVLQVTGVPTFLIYEKGNQVSRFTGAFPKTQLAAKLGL